MIIRNRDDIVAYIKCHPQVIESKKSYENDREFREIEMEMVKLIRGNVLTAHPKYGTDWSEWLSDNIDELLDEAVSIVM